MVLHSAHSSQFGMAPTQQRRGGPHAKKCLDAPSKAVPLAPAPDPPKHAHHVRRCEAGGCVEEVDDVVCKFLFFKLVSKRK